MPKFKYLSPQLAVAAQLEPSDLLLAKEAGFNSIVNNRPDFEQADQPTNQQMQQVAQQLGLDFHYLPVISGQLLDSNVQEFSRLLPTLRPPVLMYCRSGTRCTHLWALTVAPTQAVDEICATANTAGYNLDALRNRIIEHKNRSCDL